MAFSSTEYNNRYGRAPGAGARNVTPRPAIGQSFSAVFDIDGMLDEIDGLEDRFEAAARPAAQAGAEVLYSAVLANVAGLGTKTGNFENSIYQAYSKKDSVNGVQSYDITWNHRKAPHGHLIEDGFIQRYKAYIGSDGKWYTNKKAPLPTPIQRPALAPVRRAASRIPQAEEAMERKFFEVIGDDV